MEQISIVTTTSNTFAKHTGVMLYSLLHNNTENNLKLYVLYHHLSSQNKKKLKRMIKKFNRRVDFIKEVPNKYADCKLGNRLKEEVYYRLSIPQLLDNSIEKAIYLDSDIIVLENIAPLWNIHLADHLLGAVEDPGAKKYGRFKALTIPNEYGYFNSGVLVINVSQWRKLGISEKVIQYIRDNPENCRLLDQDGLNAILYDRRKSIDLKWNYQTALIGKYSIKPAIIHYTTKKKPWKYPHPLAEYYHYYEKLMDWK